MKITLYQKDKYGHGFYGAIDEAMTDKNAERLEAMREWCRTTGVNGGWSCDHNLRVCFGDEESMALFLLRWR